MVDHPEVEHLQTLDGTLGAGHGTAGASSFFPRPFIEHIVQMLHAPPQFPELGLAEVLYAIVCRRVAVIGPFAQFGRDTFPWFVNLGISGWGWHIRLPLIEVLAHSDSRCPAAGMLDLCLPV